MSGHSASPPHSLTDETIHDDPESVKDPALPHQLVGGEGQSAIPEDKVEEKLENEEDDWQHDPRNPRNWPFGKKWRTTAIVRVLYYSH